MYLIGLVFCCSAAIGFLLDLMLCLYNTSQVKFQHFLGICTLAFSVMLNVTVTLLTNTCHSLIHHKLV